MNLTMLNLLSRKSTSLVRSTFSRRISNVNKDDLQHDQDLPVTMENPFVKENPQCILCRYNIIPDYKNVRLLSQFVSPYTGRIYGRHITGLCEHKHAKVEKEISKARIAKFMPGYLKEPAFLRDPKLYDPENPLRPHKY